MLKTIQTLHIYNQTAYEKIEIPPVSDDTFSFILDKNTYAISANLTIRLESIDNAWCISESDHFTLNKGQNCYFLKKLAQNDILVINTVNNETFILLVGHDELAIPVFQKYTLDKKSSITIGTASDNSIILSENGLISKQHIKLEYLDKVWYLEDSSTNGTFINNQKAKKKQALQFGDEIHIFGYTFIFLQYIISVSEIPHLPVTIRELKKTDFETIKWLSNLPTYKEMTDTHKKNFHRPPRNIAKYHTEAFVIEAPPAPKELPKRSLFMTIGPSLTMAFPMLFSFAIMGTNMIMGVGMFLGSSVIGAFWAYMNLREQKNHAKKEEQLRLEKYRKYLKEKEDALQEIYQYNVSELNGMYPSAKKLVSHTDFSKTLWNRNNSHDDFLFVRLGTGWKEMFAPIEIPQKRFELVDDFLAQEPERIKTAYDTMRDIPLGIDLRKEKLLGIIGGENRHGIQTILLNIITQLTYTSCYTDVKLVLLADGKHHEEQQLIHSIKWFPHVWDNSQTIRYLADTKEGASDILYTLIPEFRRRIEQQSQHSIEAANILPWYIVIVLHPEILDNRQFTSFLYDKNNKIGVSTILCVENYKELPNECEYIIQNDTSFQGMFSVKDADKEKQDIQFDSITYPELTKLAHQLAPLHVSDKDEESGIPESITFMEMYQAHTMAELKVKDRWKYNRSYETLCVPIGTKANNTICYLDIHEKAHGPHGLVAGTTGSGKSEALQSYILSLAVNYSPEDVNFFLIDFKGGGMANLFQKLPHLIGQISNLSGNQIQRAIDSIRSENERRQRIFNENDVNNIYEYTKLYRNSEVQTPMPHLFIIADEFAELKKEQPECMNDLISVAAIGRSLGVHLILATQKPNGTVDDKIWSNTRFRICLRVQEPQDSNDMLKKTDAAFIKNTGRAYLQVGTDEIYEQFQSAWSGALVNETSNNTMEDIAQLYTINGKTILSGNHQKQKKKVEKKRLWVKQLIASWNQAFEQLNCSCRKYLINEDSRISVNNFLFDSFQKQEINIVNNLFTQKRFIDFATLYEEAGEGIFLDSSDENADKIMLLAEQTGRKLPEAKGKTELDAIVEHLRETAEKMNLIPKTKLWLPELKSMIPLAELTQHNDNIPSDIENEWSLNAVVGMYDDPEHQYQGTVSVDFANQGHYFISGSVSSGKSTFLQTMLYSFITKYSPANINIYAIDYSSGMLESFRNAPQVGSIMTEQEPEEIARFFFMIKNIIAERKHILRGGSYSSYIKTHPEALPAILLVIDQYPAFAERTNQIYDNQIMEIAKEGSNNGIFLCITANGIGNGELSSKLADCLQGVFCLQMNDRYQYADILKVSRVSRLPEEGIKGRGLLSMHGEILEFQTAVALEAKDDYRRAEEIQNFCLKQQSHYSGIVAKKVPVIPENPVYSEFMKEPEVQNATKNSRLLPLGYYKRSADIWSLDLSKFFCYIISGKKRTGKRNLLQLIMEAAKAKNGKIYTITSGGIIQKKTEELGGTFISPTENMSDFCKELMDIISFRNKKKHALEMAGHSDEEIYQTMSQEESIFLIIEDMVTFIEKLYRPEDDFPAFHAFFETVFDKGWFHQIFIFGAINQDNLHLISGQPAYDLFIRDYIGIHLGGNPASQKIFEYNYQAKDKNTAEAPGTGLLSTGNGSKLLTEKVILPLAGK